jgi:hypothetical protein
MKANAMTAIAGNMTAWKATAMAATAWKAPPRLASDVATERERVSRRNNWNIRLPPEN